MQKNLPGINLPGDRYLADAYSLYNVTHSSIGITSFCTFDKDSLDSPETILR